MTASFDTTRTTRAEVRYELHDNQAADLSQQLLALHPPASGHRFVCYPIGGRNVFADLGRRIELAVFDATFGNDRTVMEREYGPYEDASRFFVVMDQARQRPVGVLRVIAHSGAGLKTLRDIAAEPLRIAQQDFQDFHAVRELDNCWDIGTIAVLPEYRRSASRSREVSLMLYRAAYAHALDAGIEHFVAVIDEHALRGLRALGVPFVPINDSAPFAYLDSASSTAVYGFVPGCRSRMEARYRRLRRSRPLLWCLLAGPMRRLMHGDGIDGLVQPPLD